MFLFSLFVSYLWGIETSKNRDREWSGFRLYRTYEELKHRWIVGDNQVGFWFVSYLWGIETNSEKQHRKQKKRVCIVPMRNWNFRNSSIKYGLASVCIVPMRNWNASTFGFFVGLPSVCIVPMRNWNNRRDINKNRQNIVCIVPMRNWNVFCTDAIGCVGIGLYRTYEELKLQSCDCRSVAASVCIVPMRNWNSASFLFSCRSHQFVSYLWGIET